MQPSTPRRLQMHSCDICRRRKVRCTSVDQQPCSACIKSGVECRFTVGWRRRRRPDRPPARATSSSSSRQNDEARPTIAGDHGNAPVAVSPLGSDKTSRKRTSSSSSESSPSTRSSISHACSCSQTTLRDTPPSASVPPESEIALSMNFAENNLPRFFRDGVPSTCWTVFDVPEYLRVTYVGSHTSNMTHLIKLGRSQTQSLIYPYPQIRPTSSWDTEMLQGSPHDILRDVHSFPEKDIRDEFVESYFEKVNPYFPVIDEAEFRARYNDPSNQPPLILLHSVLLVGAHVSSHAKAKQARHVVKAVLFRRAKCVFDMRHENDRLQLIQAALLFTWHLQNGDTASANSFYWLGVACRIAFGLGLHRDLLKEPDTPDRMPQFDRRSWRRVWWTLFQAEVMSALEHGRPCAIRFDDFDQQPLCREDFREMCGQINQRTRADYCIKNTELCLIALSVVELNAPRVALRTVEMQTGVLNTQLISWMLNLSPSGSAPGDSRISSCSASAAAAGSSSVPGSASASASAVSSNNTTNHHDDFGDVNLRLHYHTVVIHLYRLQTDRCALSESASEEARRITTSASADIVSALELLHGKGMLSQCPFTSVTALMAAAIQIARDVQHALGNSHTMLAMNGLYLLERICLAAEHLSMYWPNVEGVRKVFRGLFDQFTGTLNGIQQGEVAAESLAMEDTSGVDWTDIFGMAWGRGFDGSPMWDASDLGLD